MSVYGIDSRNLFYTSKKAQLHIHWCRFLLQDRVVSSNKTGDVVCLTGPFPSSSCADLKTFSDRFLCGRAIQIYPKYRKLQHRAKKRSMAVPVPKSRTLTMIEPTNIISVRH